MIILMERWDFVGGGRRMGGERAQLGRKEGRDKKGSTEENKSPIIIITTKIK